MADNIKVYSMGTPEFVQLERAAALLTGLSPNGWTYFAGDTYFDFGQGWKWTTVLRREQPVQFLTPAEQTKIIEAKNPMQILSIVLEMAKERSLRNDTDW